MHSLQANHPFEEKILKRDKTGSTTNLWTHLSSSHPSIHQELRPQRVSNPLTNFFSKEEKYPKRSSELTKDKCLSLIVKTDMPFAVIEHPEIESFCSYFAECKVTLPSASTLRRALSTKFIDEKDQIRELFRPIQKVSLTVDTWTTTNHISVLGITIHWIDNGWTLHERVLSVEELAESHAGEHMAEVLYRVLVDYNLRDKVNFTKIYISLIYKLIYSLCLCRCVRSLPTMRAIIQVWRKS